VAEGGTVLEGSTRVDGLALKWFPKAEAWGLLWVLAMP
jgi:hypothetical protein